MTTHSTRPRRALSVTLAAAVTLALSATTLTTAQAADDTPGKLTLKVSSNRDSTGYNLGDDVVFTYTATNETGAPIDTSGGQLIAYFEDGPGTDHRFGGDCSWTGWEPDEITYEAWYETPTEFAVGATVTCTLTHTATEADVDRGGLWALFAFRPGTWEDVNGWMYAYWATVVPTGRPERPAVLGGAATVGKPLTVAPWWFKPFGAERTYQWQRNGVAIPGATGTTYKPGTADVGAKLTYRTYAPDLGVSWLSQATAAVKAGTLTAATPTIAGTAEVGVKLTARPGTWAPAGTKLAYQWLRNGAKITGATKTTYTPVPGDVGRKLTVAVTGTAAGYTTRTVSSKATAVVARGTIAVKVAPKITGTARVGKKLTAVPPKVDVTGVTYSRQWLRNGKAIKSATKATYTLRPADKGKRISVQFTIRKAGYTTKTTTSARSAAVKAR